jgi:hypothetical protein
MSLNSSGPISLGGSTVGQSVSLELGLSATVTISLNDTNVRSLFGVASGTISLSQGYGKSSYTTASTKVLYAGGNAGPVLVTVADDIDGFAFATETLINPAASLNQSRNSAGGHHTSSKGYFLGGSQGSPRSVPYAAVDGIVFATETKFTPTTAPIIAGPRGTSTFGGADAGYNTNGTTKFIYATETLSSAGAGFMNLYAPNPIGSAGRSSMALTQSPTRGYRHAGQNVFNQSLNYLTEIDGLIFATDTLINPAAAAATARPAPIGHNSPTTGFASGGYGIAYNSYFNEIDGITFSTEAAVNPAAALVQARQFLGGNHGSNSQTKGYCVGGSTSANLTQIDGLQYSTSTAIDPATAISRVGGVAGNGVQDSNN